MTQPMDSTGVDDAQALRLRVLELEKSESALRERVEFFERLLDGVTEMMVVKGPDLRIAYANRAFCEFQGRSREEIVEAGAASMGDAAEAERWQEGDKHVLATGNIAWSPLASLTRHDGKRLQFDTVRSVVRGSDGAPSMLITVARNAREGSAEQALAQSEVHQRALRGVIPDLVFRIDREGVYLDYSAPRDMDLAVPPAAFLGKKMTEFLPDIAPLFLKNIHEALETGGLRTFEYALFFGGGVSHFEARMVPSGPNDVFAVIRDITAQKRVEETLRESEDRFRRLVEHALVGIFVMKEGQLSYVNPQLAALFGCTQEELLSLETICGRVDEEDAQALGARFQSLLSEGERGDAEGFRATIRGLRKDGARIVFELQVTRTTFESKPAIIGTVVDVTEQRRTEEEQRRLQEELLRAQETVLLELSTPLIPISDTVVAMPLVGELDTRRMDQVLERLLGGISKSRARTAIVDITGVPGVSREVADALIRTVQAARLLGTEVMLTGLRPEVARTLSSLGVDLSGIVTLGTLQAGIQRAMRRG